MEYITKEGLKNSLLKVGLSKGDVVIIHSNISNFGFPENFSRKDALLMYYEAFKEVLGDEGTICVPAYFYEYARYGIPYDIELSPISKELGVFAKFINSLPERKRSCNPLTAVAAIGKHADYICEPINRHSYGENSAFDRLYKLNAKIILLGVTGGVTINHLAEYKVGVPYLYNKVYNLPILSNGKQIFDSSIGYVRYLNYDIEYSGQVDETWAENTWLKEKFINKVSYLHSKIYAIETKNAISYIMNKLYDNPYCFLTHKPYFPEGKVPNDGPVLKNK